MTTPEHPLSTREAAACLGIKPATLTAWRCTRVVEIPYIKIGRRVVYRQRDLEAFLEAQRVSSGTADTPTLRNPKG